MAIIITRFLHGGLSSFDEPCSHDEPLVSDIIAEWENEFALCGKIGTTLRGVVPYLRLSRDNFPTLKALVISS